LAIEPLLSLSIVLEKTYQEDGKNWKCYQKIQPIDDAADFLFPEGLLTDANAQACLERAFLPRSQPTSSSTISMTKFCYLYMEIMVSAIEILHSEK